MRSLSEGYYYLLGRLADESSEVEKWLKRYIGMMAQIEEGLAFCMFAGTRANNLINILAAVFDHQIGNRGKHKELVVLLGRLETAMKKRDEYIHSHWIFWDTYDIVIREKNRISSRKFERGRKRPALKELQDTLAEIYSTRTAIGKLVAITLLELQHGLMSTNPSN